MDYAQWNYEIELQTKQRKMKLSITLLSQSDSSLCILLNPILYDADST
jgi:hypothetical protein